MMNFARFVSSMHNRDSTSQDSRPTVRCTACELGPAGNTWLVKRV